MDERREAHRRASDIEREKHLIHHSYIDQLLDERAERRVRMEKIKTSVFGWLVITVLGGIGTAIYSLFRTASEHFNWR